MARGADTKERIIQVAIGLFVRKGIAATTTKDIAAAAEIAEGTIYRHFPSKDALAAEAFLDNYLPFAKILDAIQRRAEGPRRKVEAMVRHAYAAFDRDRDIFAFLLIAQHGPVAPIGADTPTPVTVLEDAIRTGIQAGVVRDLDVPLAAQIVLGMILQPATASLHAKIEGPLEPMAPAVADAIWRVLTARS